MKKFLVCALVLVICLTAFVACKDKGADLEDLNRAKEFLSTQLNGMKEVTGKDYKLPAVVAIDGVNYTVTWTLTVNTGSDTVVSLGSVENSLQTINIDEFASAEATYTLTATIADENGNTVTVTANRKVPKFVVNTYAEYVAGCAADDRETIYTVKGYVIGVNAAPLSSSKGSVWIMDDDGHGYYAYKAAHVEGIDYSTRESINAAFPLGTEVVIKGKATNYQGGNQFAEGCEIILTGNSTDVATKFPYVDQTALWGSAANGSDHTKLADTQSTRISLTNVTLGSNSGKNYTFTVNGVEFIWYMDVYLVDDATRDAFIAKWVKGKTANIKGVVNTFSGNYQVYPDGADSLQIIEENLNDAQKVAKEKENLTLEELYRENFTLPEGTWADIEWAITGTGATLGANNLVTINRTSADQTVTITATITSGTESDTKEFSVTIPAAAAGIVVGTPYTITANNDNGPIYFNGQVNSGRFGGSTAAADAAVVYVEAASNAGEYYLYMTDGTTKTYICMDDKAAGAKFTTTVANATIYEWNEVLSTLVVADDNNNRAFGASGTFTTFSCYDISNTYSWGQFVVYIPADPDAPVSDDAKISAEKAALTFAVKEYTENGTETLPVVGETYPEVAIAWSSEATELAIDGANLTVTAPADNKIVTITATITCGTGTAVTKEFEILFNVKVETTIEGALAAPVGVSATLSGTVEDAKSSEFYINDGTNRILVYKPATKAYNGDVVTVSGKISAYKGVNQINTGATVTITTAHTCSYGQATCTEAATCTSCGATTGEALGHIDVEAPTDICDRCEADLAAQVIATFTFGENVTGEEHKDGSEITTVPKSYTDGDYSLNITAASKAYDGANDATGISCLKLGTSSAVGTITFTADDDAQYVYIYVAQYKAKTTKVTINGGDAQTITTSSDDGAYTCIKVDVSQNKTVTVATVSGAARAMIDKIEYIA